jgi:hypothetical protein
LRSNDISKLADSCHANTSDDGQVCRVAMWTGKTRLR